MRLPYQALDLGVGSLGYAHAGDAGIDLRINLHPNQDPIQRFPDVKMESEADEHDHLVLLPNQRILAPTGISVEIPEGCVGFVCPRSGLAWKEGVTVANSPGVVDSGFRGEIKVILVNHGFKPYRLVKNEKIAQLVILPFVRVVPTLTPTLLDSDRGQNGFGSSGRT